MKTNDDDNDEPVYDHTEGPIAWECPMCGGCGYQLGVLGKLVWFRCEDCGIDFKWEWVKCRIDRRYVETVAHHWRAVC